MDIQQSRTTLHNPRKNMRIVVFQVAIDTKTRTQWTGQQTATSGSTNKRELIEVDLYRTSRRSLIYHNINAIVFHRRIEILLYNRRKAVNLINEEHIVFLKRSKQARQVAWFIKHRARSHLEPYPQFVGNDVTKGSFTQSWRAKEEHVV